MINLKDEAREGCNFQACTIVDYYYPSGFNVSCINFEQNVYYNICVIDCMNKQSQPFELLIIVASYLSYLRKR